ncbi:hypothetical protein CGC49_01990 [Capnocytophaga sp. H4358]|nr:hypothetical protein CGC49_01990 [Capnocytophaga sp. H4358]
MFFHRKDAIEPEQYHLTIRNNYFESVSVSIEPYFSENIVAGASSSSFFLPKGSYSIVAITKSQLKLKSTFTLQGKREQLIMKINEKGSFRIK